MLYMPLSRGWVWSFIPSGGALPPMMDDSVLPPLLFAESSAVLAGNP